MPDWKLCFLRGQVDFENLRLCARNHTFLVIFIVNNVKCYFLGI